MSNPAATLPDGIHLDVPFADYVAIDAVSNSGALAKMRRSPLYYLKTRGEETPGTPAMQSGNAVNDLVLQPDRFDERLVVAGRCVATLAKGGVCTKNGSKVIDGLSYCGTHADETAEADPRITLTPEQFRRAKDMAAAVLSDEDAAPLLLRCKLREVTLVWTDRATGLRCKGRIDAIEDGTANPFVLPKMLDLKKSRKARPSDFPGEIMRRGYHAQLAWYDTGYHAITGIHTEPYIVAVNDQPGDDVHEVGTYQIIADAIEAGRDANRKTLALIRKCLDENRYPGFGALPLSIPAWGLANDEDDADEAEQEIA